MDSTKAPGHLAGVMELTAEQIRDGAERYTDVFDGYEEEEAQLKRLPEAFTDGSWEWGDLEYVIQWKALRPFEEKAIADLNDQPKRKVEIAIEKALDTNVVVEKLERLREIKGVGLPTATALLTFMNPRAYTVLDEKAWRTLYEAGHVYETPKDEWELADYLKYLGACHGLANELDMKLRSLDRGLWTIA